jgi:hypothetical protein
LLIAEHGLEFLITYAAGFRAASRLAPETTTVPEQRWWLLRTVASAVDREEVRARCDYGRFVAVREPELVAWLSRMPEETRSDLLAANPDVLGKQLLRTDLPDDVSAWPVTPPARRAP